MTVYYVTHTVSVELAKYECYLKITQSWSGTCQSKPKANTESKKGMLGFKTKFKLDAGCWMQTAFIEAAVAR